MTCIVGLIDKDIIYMGGDSAACTDCTLSITKNPKVFKKDGFLFGISGSSRIHDILKYNFKFPKDKLVDPLRYLNKNFIPSLRTCLARNGLLSIENEIESFEAWVLVGYKGRLFTIEANFHVSESNRNYETVGCGGSEAMGALFSLENIDEIVDTSWLTPQMKIMVALEASEAFNCHVRRPFTVINSSDMD